MQVNHRSHVRLSGIGTAVNHPVQFGTQEAVAAILPVTYSRRLQLSFFD
jgi:hypothetical protein